MESELRGYVFSPGGGHSAQFQTYIVASEHSQMKGQQLQRDHTQDTLEAVDRVGQFDRLVRELGTLSVVSGAQDNRATLQPRSRITTRRWSQKESPLTYSRVSGINLMATITVISCFCCSYGGGDAHSWLKGQSVGSRWVSFSPFPSRVIASLWNSFSTHLLSGFHVPCQGQGVEKKP